VCRTLEVFRRTDYQKAWMTIPVATSWLAVRVADQFASGVRDAPSDQAIDTTPRHHC
jgi:hypothetical protein